MLTWMLHRLSQTLMILTVHLSLKRGLHSIKQSPTELPQTHAKQLLKYVREFYVRPVYGSPVSTVFCDSPCDMLVDDMSAIGDELFFSEDDE